MIQQKVREGFDRAMRPIGQALARAHVDPDVLTIAGLLLQIGVALLILRGSILAAGLVAIAGGVFDVFDGAVAKARGITSNFGALLDSTMDRIGDALVFVPLAWLYGVSPDVAERDEPWVAALALVALVASFMVSYVRARAEALGYDCNVGLAERAERLILIIVGLVFDVVPAALVILTVLASVTFIQRLLHVRAQARAI